MRSTADSPKLFPPFPDLTVFGGTGEISTPTTKIKVYTTVVLTSLLYGYESWTGYQRHTKKLNNFHTKRLGRILGIS